MSDDGQVVALGQPGGSVYVSTDGGVSFVQQTALGVAITTGAWGVTVSGDGHTIMVGRPTSTSSAGVLFVAHGVADAASISWADQSAKVPGSAQVTGVTNRAWSVASSGDGQVLIAARPHTNNTAAGYGYAFTSRDAGASWVQVASLD
ncbi:MULTISPECIES: hypothetical protein, partial [unclassified Leucobacter]|uniref:hypothetical protein n=1 Tax=unclassified Leucobacter TaxID=2621730 RepID=UPI00301931EC